MAAFLHDTFTHGSAATGLETHAPETGGAWVQAGSLFIAQNATVFIWPDGWVRSTNTTGITCAYNNVTPPSAAVRITAVVGRNTDTSSSQIGIYWGCVPGTSTAYRLQIAQARVDLLRINNSSPTGLGNSVPGTGVTVANGLVTYEIVSAGGVITVSRNGVVILSVTDPAPLANGFVGVGGGSQGFVTEITAEEAVGVPTTTIGTIAAAASVTGAAQAFKAAVGTITAGANNAIFTSMKFHQGYGTIIGGATSNFIGLTITDVEGVGTITAGAAVQGIGQSIRAATGSIAASSDSNWSAAGLEVGETVGTIAAGAAMEGQGGRVMRMLGMITGVASSNMIGSSLAEASGAIEGVAQVMGIGRSFQAGETDGTITTAATVNGVGEAVISTVGTIAGMTTVTGKIVTGSVGRISGAATIVGRGQAVKSSVGTIAGSVSSNMIGSQFEGSEGIIRGSAEANGVGHAIIETTGTITGAADSYFLSFGVTAFETPSSRTIVLSREDRSIVVKAEDRTIVIPRSVMTITPEIESRTIAVPLENRTITVAAENRIIAVNPENRKITL